MKKIAITPGKLILSGEHAVVYGKPALAMAIDLSARSEITPDESRNISFNLVDLDENERFTLLALRDFKKRVIKNYHFFLEGRLGIRDVLKKPVDLFQFAFIMLLDGLHLKLQHGLNIQLQSNIPIGCGLGSSAATVLSTLRVAGHYFRVDFRPDWYMEYSLEAEKLQHGYPSGVDSHISLHGGCARFQRGQAQSVPLPPTPIHLVHTGAPSCTTGECVAAVKADHEDDAIWDDFEAVTLGMEDALIRESLEDMQICIRENHRLLSAIGVVPNKVRSFVKRVEDTGGAAKTCGAGAVEGENGGMVMVASERAPLELCREYGYSMISVRGDPLGSRVL